MVDKDILYNFLNLIPSGKVISYKTLATIFCTGPRIIGKMIGQNIELEKYACYKVVGTDGSLRGYAAGLETKKHKLENDNIILYKNKVPKNYFWEPIITNYYISLVTKDTQAIKNFQAISHKIKLLHPTCIIKTPIHYHITLADLSNTPITANLIKNIFGEVDGLLHFIFQCTLYKPYIDTKKNKVIFWIRLSNNPFLLTLQHCIKKYVRRNTDKQFLPHITLGKILGTIEYNKKVLDNSLDIECVFDHICISANIDQQKDQILFEKKFIQ